MSVKGDQDRISGDQKDPYIQSCALSSPIAAQIDNTSLFDAAGHWPYSRSGSDAAAEGQGGGCRRTFGGQISFPGVY